MATMILQKSVFIRISKQIVWHYLYQMNQWPKWSEAFHHVKILETPKVDAKGKFFFQNGKVKSFSITRLEQDNFLEFTMPFFTTELIIGLRAAEIPEGTGIVATVQGIGFFESIVAKVGKRKITRILDRFLSELKSATENHVEKVEYLKQA